MAYQFFAKAHQAKRPSSASPPLPQHSSSPQPSLSAHGRPPKYPTPIVMSQSSLPSTPSSVNITAKLKPPTAKDASLQPPAYPHAIQPGYTTPHEHVTIEPVSTAHIPSLSRITGLLLPIRYPNSFYTATVTDPVIASVSRVAIYHDHPFTAVLFSASTASSATGTDKVIGGIRCRLESVSQSTPETPQSQGQEQEPTNLYIQTLHLLSPYRGYGIAASLLNSLLFSNSHSLIAPSGMQPDYEVSELVEHYNIRTVTAHVHEANDDGLKWYISRGFQVEDRIVENYYRRLKPSGAKIVKLTLQRDGSSNSNPTKAIDHPPPMSEQARQERNLTPEPDDDWEKVEAEDELDADELGVQSVTGSKLFDFDDFSRRKRKADGEP
ncbi:putative GNAT family acetyltransferase [Aspergillus californicus]